jgi:hypothetical protein
MILGIVPFFGGISVAAHSYQDTRLDYFRQCIDSLRGVCDPIVVPVCVPADLEAVKSVDPKLEAKLIRCHPHFLPYTALCLIQKGPVPEHVLVTEADQVYFWDSLPKLLEVIDANRYFSPHRAERVYETTGLGRGEEITINGSTHVVINNCAGMTPENDFYHVCKDKGQAFGGGFLCSGDLFKRVRFRHSDWLPIEHSTAFDIFETPGAVGLKTANFRDFYCNHLSGYDYHEQIHKGQRDW